jgi:predicted aspartyl protease
LGRLISIFSFALMVASNLPAATPVPFQYRDGMIWLKVAVAGRNEPLNFLVDSGAGASVLDLGTARRLGLKLDQPMTVQGVNGHTTAYHARDFNARTAGVPVASSLLAVDLSGPSSSCHQHIDGLLGADFFRDHIVQINYAARTIRLLERNEVNPAGCEVLPLVKCNDTFSVRASVAGNAPELMRVDTGCCTALEWVVTGSKAKKLTSTTIGLKSGTMHDFSTDVQLGSIRVTAVKTGVHTSQMFAGEAGLIGNGLLSRFTVTIDTGKQRCLLSGR